jgi:chromosome segregation ATPase
MIVVCLESEFKFGGTIEEGLLNPNEVDFRGALRELTGAWEKKCEALKRKEREPLEQIIESNKEEMRRIVGELGAVHETRIVAEERVKELEVDNGKLEVELTQLRSEASELKDRSIMVDDLERSRSEVAMLAELQRIEGESKERGLKGELTEVKRKYEEKMRQLERKLAKENWDKEERFRGEIKALKSEKNDLMLQTETAVNEERMKIRDVEDAMHRKDVTNQREINKFEVEVMGLRNEVERLSRRGVERDLLVLKENIDVIERAGEGNGGGSGKKYGGDDIQARLAQIENLALSLEEGAIGSVIGTPVGIEETISPEGKERGDRLDIKGEEGEEGGDGEGEGAKVGISDNVTERRKGKRASVDEEEEEDGGGQEEELF